MALPLEHECVERLGIIAGRGTLPHDVAMAARLAGENPYILQLLDEADQDWSDFDHTSVHVGDFAALRSLISQQKISRLVMAGSVKKRPQLTQIRPTFKTLIKVPMIVKDLLSGGDDKLLRSVIALIEAQGCRVVGAHEVVPNLLAQIGPIGDLDLSQSDRTDCKAATTAARLLGSLDIGQGAVSVGGRVVALEGLEGTDQMLARVAQLRSDGRLPARQKGVLVKLCKPTQDLRADLPTIGVDTVIHAKQAGLSAIIVEAGRSLVLQREEVIARANKEKIAIYGQERDIP